MDIRKVSLIKETVFSEGGAPAARPVTRAIGMAVIANPCAGRYVEDLSPLFADGAELGRRLMGDLVKLLSQPAVMYGKAAIVGVSGELEHGAALLHPKLGQPMREAIGGGEAIICSTAKVAAAGTTIDVPLAHKDNIWSFDHLDTVTVSMADAPRPDEIMLVMALADAGRVRPRVGKGRVSAAK
jgi:hypothetical protein